MENDCQTIPDYETDYDCEEWRDIADSRYSGLYQVSNLGRVRSTATQEIVRPFKQSIYLTAHDGEISASTTHRLVADAFDCAGDPRGRNVYRINGDKSDNRANNLFRTSKRMFYAYKPCLCSDGHFYRTVIAAHLATGVPLKTINSMISGKGVKTYKGYSFAPVPNFDSLKDAIGQSCRPDCLANICGVEDKFSKSLVFAAVFNGYQTKHEDDGGLVLTIQDTL